MIKHSHIQSCNLGFSGRFLYSTDFHYFIFLRLQISKAANLINFAIISGYLCNTSLHIHLAAKKYNDSWFACFWPVLLGWMGFNFHLYSFCVFAPLGRLWKCCMSKNMLWFFSVSLRLQKAYFNAAKHSSLPKAYFNSRWFD